MNYEREDLFLILLILDPFNWGIDFELAAHGAGDPAISGIEANSVSGQQPSHHRGDRRGACSKGSRKNNFTF